MCPSLGYLARVSERHELHCLPQQLGRLGEEVAVLLVGQRHEQAAVVGRVQSAARGLIMLMRQTL